MTTAYNPQIDESLYLFTVVEFMVDLFPPKNDRR